MSRCDRDCLRPRSVVGGWDCCHLSEPGCAVLEALEAGRIHPDRYGCYRALLDAGDTDEPSI